MIPQNLKSNKMFWVGVAVLVYGVVLFFSAGLTLKSVAAIGVGGYVVLSLVSPSLLSKLKTRAILWFKSLNDKANPVEPAPVVSMAEFKPAEFIYGETLSTERDYHKFFKPEDNDAIGYLAIEALKMKNDNAVSHLKVAHTEFYDIALQRAKQAEGSSDEKTE